MRQNGKNKPAHDIFVLPSYYGGAVELPYLQGGGADFLRRLHPHRDEIDLLSELDVDDRMANFSQTSGLKYDSDGRVGLPPDLIVHAQIERDLYFIGLGERFHIWSP